MTSIADLKPDPANARKHNPRNVGMIERSLQEVGAARSIVIDEDDVVLAGNGVLEAAALAGIERVKVVDADGSTIVAVRRSGLTDEQKRRLALYDNRTAELAEWDADVLAAVADADAAALDGLFSEDELAAVLADAMHGNPDVDAEPQIDRAGELAKEWGTVLGQVWRLGDHRLACGDCTDAAVVARCLDGAKPNLMVTDPPYGVEYDANWRNEAAAAGKLAYAASRVRPVENDDRTDWSEAYLLFPGAVAYTWSPPGDHVIHTWQAMLAAGFEIRNQIIWAKPHFPISRGHYTYRHEPCWYGVRKGETAQWVGDASASTLWEIALDRNVDGGHSTQKPLECMARPIRNHEGDVYDPFVGSGTTIIAAEQLGRHCYAIEIDPGYVAVCLQRYLDATGKRPELADG
jgi:DNA modification methylase